MEINKPELSKSNDEPLSGNPKVKYDVEKHCCTVSDTILKSKQAKRSVLHSIFHVVHNLGKFD